MAGHPALPDKIKPTQGIPWRQVLPGGCYRVCYDPVSDDQRRRRFPCAGTLRVQHEGTGTIASGDLYRQPFCPQDSSEEIPAYPIALYRFYLVVKEIRWDTSLTLKCALWSFYDTHREWKEEGWFVLVLAESSAGHWRGDVKNSTGTVLGRTELTWVSPYLRRALLEIDSEDQVSHPLDSGAGVGWDTVFDTVGWKVEVACSDRNVPAPNGGGAWSSTDLLEALRKWRRPADLDQEWLYHLFCVRRYQGSKWGYMYDEFTRQGAVVGACMELSDEVFGEYRGRLLGEFPDLYFRTALHEFGHLIGLHHNDDGTCLMRMLAAVAADASRPPFPANVQFRFNSYDQMKLRHRSDLWVRPGYLAYDDLE